MLSRLRAFARRLARNRAKGSLASRVEYLEEVVRYLDFQVTSQASLLRHLSGPLAAERAEAAATKASFDFQWDAIPGGRYMLEDPRFRHDAPGYVCEYTGLPAAWFSGRFVIDAGCGLGRYSWALCQLGARVLSLDQSEHGLARTREACRAFPDHRAVQVDLLRELPLTEPADLVWSFGVLHHTGDTYRAFRNIVPWVKPGGYLALMLYGKPREGIRSDYATVNEYDEWRQRTRNLPLSGKLATITAAMNAGAFEAAGAEHIHGYFDAIAPPINDLYTFEEVEGWLLDAGFTGIRRTVETRNLHIVAQRPAQ
jgi:SAM-dependent methyltransferase